jgi:hypothetical protein
VEQVTGAERIKAMNADILAFVAPHLPVQPEGLTADGRAAFRQQYNAAWRAAMTQTDHIRRAHGLVPCGDAPGWKFA